VGSRVVAGERRLRATRWGAVHHPDNAHFAAIPAVVCPGPLGKAERRVWQLVENLAREDLQPGELAAALLYERCAVLVSKLLDAGVAVPAEVHLDDPVLRWEALERLRVRSACHQLGAPWKEVLRRLVIPHGPSPAREETGSESRAIPPIQPLATVHSREDTCSPPSPRSPTSISS
jgi:ParB family chromosome partitioning protein